MIPRPAVAPFNYRPKLSLTSVPAVEPMAQPDIAAHVHRLTRAAARLRALQCQRFGSARTKRRH